MPSSVRRAANEVGMKEQTEEGDQAYLILRQGSGCSLSLPNDAWQLAETGTSFRRGAPAGVLLRSGALRLHSLQLPLDAAYLHGTNVGTV